MDDTTVMVGARPKRSLTQNWGQNRQRVDRSRSSSRGWAILRKRRICRIEIDTDDRGMEIETDDTMLFRPRAVSLGFVDTPIGMGPATTLKSLRDLGAAEEDLRNCVSPSLRLSKIRRLWTICSRRLWSSTTETTSTLEPRDDASSSSIILEPDIVVLNPPTRDIPDQRPDGVSSNHFLLKSMTEVRLRRTEAGLRSHQEVNAATLIWSEADNDATQKIREGQDKAEPSRLSWTSWRSRSASFQPGWTWERRKSAVWRVYACSELWISAPNYRNSTRG